MADKDINRNPSDKMPDEDILSELEVLSQKYGLPFEKENKPKKAPLSSSSPYTSGKISTEPGSYRPPKHNHPARTPRVIYDTGKPGAGVRVVYGDEDDLPEGPQGRRVIYQEPETESIYAKRQRSAAARRQAERKAGEFGSQPTVRRVAVSRPADKQTDPNVFAKAYSEISHQQKQSIEDVPVAKPGPENPDTDVRTTGDKDKKAAGKQPLPHYKPTAKERTKRFFSAFLPWKGDPAKEVIRKIVMDISAILVLACFGYFVDNYIQHKNHLANQNGFIDSVTEPETDELDAKWAAIKAKYPDVDFPDGMNIRFAELYAQNQDLVGWLTVPGTNIDTLVLHHVEDNDNAEGEEDFYLHHNFYKKYDKYGNAYLDSYNTGATLDQNNTIYGHNMRDGLSFAQLEKYYTIDGFKESPILQYSTLFEDYYFKVYAVFITNGYPSGDNGYLFNYPVATFPSEENFMKFIEALDERKLYDTGVDINKDDKLLTLSTCSYEIKTTDMGRLAVVGRLVRPGESLTVDTSKAVKNNSIRYPQVWYDEHKQTNPFAGAYQWIPE